MQRLFLTALIWVASVISMPPTAGAVSLSTQCVCITGTQPYLWVPFFKAGCALWLAENLCLRGTIQPMDRPIRLDSFSSEELRLGVVAERDFSTDFIAFLEQRISPLLTLGAKGNFSVLRIDDTACNGLRNPESVYSWLEQASKVFKGKIEIKANQTISLGMWRPFFPGRPNFTAIARSGEPYQLPACSDYAGHRCAEGPQGGMSAECRDINGQILTLRCASSESLHFYIDEFGSPQSWSEHLFYWQRDP